jgi:hypothetical protein
MAPTPTRARRSRARGPRPSRSPAARRPRSPRRVTTGRCKRASRRRDTFVLSTGNAAAVTLGTGASQIKFIGPSAVTLTGGSGQAVGTADAGSNRFVAGTGSLDVTGGGGKDGYVFHANSGLLTLQELLARQGRHADRGQGAARLAAAGLRRSGRHNALLRVWCSATPCGPSSTKLQQLPCPAAVDRRSLS